MKNLLLFIVLFYWVLLQNPSYSQDNPVYPTIIKTPIAFEITKPLKDNPIVEDEPVELTEEFFMNAQRKRKINPDVFPPDFDNMPIDPNMQTKPGWIEGSKATIMNFAGQNSSSYPPDCSGDANSTYFFQVVNVRYAIYNKTTGAIVAGPSNLNTIFNSSLPGAGCNDGDPIVLWDEQANRWLYAEFALCGSNDYMLIAVSQTSDPTGSWYSWSFDVADVPDYMKFGIWQDGYYMATNTSPGNDVYVFNRAAMIAGNPSPTMIGFDNPWRPVTFDGFHCIMPLDNDGPWAPSGTPGQFITIVDNGQSNPADQLWIYQLVANWTTPSSSTFNRTQTINVNAFSGNFNNSWNNVPQPGTTQKLDAISTVLMFRAQYRNFSGTQRIVCAHAIAQTSTQAVMRWYELENTGSGWSVRQQSTYNPDVYSRWNMGIAMNGSREIGIGYSISHSTTVYPGIRYIGQSASANAAANNTLDMAETVIYTGTLSQTGINRWGDYSQISVDPIDDHTFWYTNEYMASSTHGTRIASFQFSTPGGPPVADFSADNTLPSSSMVTVNFTDLSTKTPTSWLWSFSPSTVTYVSGTSATSQNPSVRFNNSGAYTVTLTATNSFGNDSETKINYIHQGQPGVWTGSSSTDWNTAINWQNHLVPGASDNVFIYPTALYWPTKTGHFTIGTDCNSLILTNGTEMTVTGNFTINSGKTLNMVDVCTLKIGGNWLNNGTFSPGAGTIEFYGNNPGIINPSSSTMLINENFNTFPGSWLGNTATTPTANSFYQVSSANAGGTSPEIRYQRRNQTSNTTRRIYFGPVNTSGLTTLNFEFRHMVDDRNSSGYTVNAEYSINGVTWNNAGWSVSPTADIPSTAVSLTLGTSQGVGASAYYIAFMITGNLSRIDYWYIDDVKLYFTPVYSEFFSNLLISKNNNTVITNSNITVNANFTIKPNAYFTNSTGNNLTVNGSSLFMADNTGMASFIDNGTSSFAFPPNIQLYLTPQHWHFISSPVNGALSGVFLGNYLRTFDEATYSWNPYITPENIPLNVMLGYAAWVPGAVPDVVTFNGIPNNGNLSIPVTSNSTLANTGWNLVGNPYPSSLDWDGTGWGKSNIDNTIYYYSGVSGMSNYHYYIGSGSAPYSGIAVNDGTNEIPPMQAFFVHATSNGNLSTANTARIHSGQSYYKSGEDNGAKVKMIRLEVLGNDLKDETVIRFIPQSTEGFDGQFDAYKLFAHDYPQVYTKSSSTELAVNTLPEVEDDLVIPVFFTAPIPQEYSLSFKEIIGFGDQIIYLEDLLTGHITKIFPDLIYHFEYSLQNNDERFLIHFSNPLGFGDESSEPPSIYVFDKTVYVQFAKEVKGQITVYNLMGQEIAYRESAGKELVKMELNSKTGYYLVKVQTGELFITKKVFIK